MLVVNFLAIYVHGILAINYKLATLTAILIHKQKVLEWNAAGCGLSPNLECYGALASRRFYILAKIARIYGFEMSWLCQNIKVKV